MEESNIQNSDVEIPTLMRKRPFPYCFLLETDHLLVNSESAVSVCIDSRYIGNNTRFVRKSCNPNAEIRNIKSGYHIKFVLVTTREIKAGEEITIRFEFKCKTYQYELECACGDAKTCKISNYYGKKTSNSNSGSAEVKPVVSPKPVVTRTSRSNTPTSMLEQPHDDPDRPKLTSKDNSLISSENILDSNPTRSTRSYTRKPGAKKGQGGARGRKRKKNEEDNALKPLDDFGLSNQYDEFKALVLAHRKKNPLTCPMLPTDPNFPSEKFKYLPFYTKYEKFDLEDESTYAGKDFKVITASEDEKIKKAAKESLANLNKAKPINFHYHGANNVIKVGELPMNMVKNFDKSQHRFRDNSFGAKKLKNRVGFLGRIFFLFYRGKIS